MKPTFFKNQQEFRKWLEKNHAKKTELIVGFHKVDTGKPSMTWSQSVDQALCFGWIDGVRRSVDKDSYCIRFTPRKPTSIWSAINIKKVAELKKQGLMHESGLTAFSKLKAHKSNVYSFEQKEVKFIPAYEKLFKANKKAWNYFQALAPGYKKTSVHHVMSAKQEATQLKRLKALIADSEKGTNAWRNNKYAKR
ncbi:MAG TPA: YdeI/OmpD-associated family protein [Flavobacteriales bacterium]|nr:YdeI/OmpD-associated family protein [Flavobacteriales bacterium]